jgi:hypothetical protein
MSGAVENSFRTKPVVKGVAELEQVVLLTGKSVVREITIRTYRKILPSSDRRVDLTITATHAEIEEVLEAGGINLLTELGPVIRDIKGEKATACGTFTDANNCVPPIDPSPPCTGAQQPFRLKDGDNYTSLSGTGYVVSGTLQSVGEPYPEGTVITGSLILILARAARPAG